MRRFLKNFRVFKMLLCGLAVLLTSALSGCQAEPELPVVKLSVWGDERNQPLLEEALAEFKEEHRDEAIFEFTISMESELTCKETVLADPESAADIYTFADDQFEELWRAGALLEITDSAEEIIEGVGGSSSGAAQASMRGGKLYAYPETAGNGYFLYYDSSYFTEDDVKSLDRILEIAAENGKKFAMDFTSGWYIYSFFKGAGLDIYSDGNVNICNWNASDTTYTGVEVVEAMLAVAKHDGFLSCNDAKFVEGIRDGSIIAGVNGAWNAEYILAALGENYETDKLPEYTLAGDSVQLCSFTGYKLMGVNAYTDYPEWAMKLARYLNREEMQLKRFQQIGECPANVNAAASEEVKKSKAVAALARQSQYGYTQNVEDPFWDGACFLGTTIAGGNSDNRDIQELLDKVTEMITAPSRLAEGKETSKTE